MNKAKNLKLNKMLGFWESFFLESAGASGGLGLIWNPRRVDIHCLEFSNNWICARVQNLKSDLKFILINIYGPISHLGKKIVWDELSSIFHNYKDNPILVGGDFNTILNLEEKVGGSKHLSHSSSDFKTWIGKHNMIDVPMNDGIFT